MEDIKIDHGDHEHSLMDMLQDMVEKNHELSDRIESMYMVTEVMRKALRQMLTESGQEVHVQINDIGGVSMTGEDGSEIDAVVLFIDPEGILDIREA